MPSQLRSSLPVCDFFLTYLPTYLSILTDTPLFFFLSYLRYSSLAVSLPLRRFAPLYPICVLLFFPLVYFPASSGFYLDYSIRSSCFTYFDPFSSSIFSHTLPLFFCVHPALSCFSMPSSYCFSSPHYLMFGILLTSFSG